jgi:hypothetical protein
MTVTERHTPQMSEEPDCNVLADHGIYCLSSRSATLRGPLQPRGARIAVVGHSSTVGCSATGAVEG